MDIKLPKGKYIIAVSGGVDSVVLLHLLNQNHEHRIQNLQVAHFDHGIRDDSAKDEQFVKTLADRYGLAYISERAELGKSTSEATARDARYAFLRRVLAGQGGEKIVTAHHQDDLLETMILNMLRGTGRKGLDPLLSSADILRPLLSYPKENIIGYARTHGLDWREDSTNADLRYKRNIVRQKLMPKLKNKRQLLLDMNSAAHTLNSEIDALLTELHIVLIDESESLIRSRFVQLPHKVAAEYMYLWLDKHGVKNVSNSVVTKATIAAKTLQPGKKINLGGQHWLRSNTTSVKIYPIE